MNFTKKQNQLITDLKRVLAAGPLCTAEIRRALGGHVQSYETCLRDRLFRLYSKGALDSNETLVQGYCVRREWSLKGDGK